MAERSNAAVLKTVEGHTSGGSNPSLSAKEKAMRSVAFFVCWNPETACGHKDEGIQKASYLSLIASKNSNAL